MSRPLPSSFDGNEEFYEENRWAKFKRRLFEEPLIPLGCAVTCYALWRASRSIKYGDHVTANKMFRARIYGQAFTIAVMVGGSFYYAKDREKRKELEAGVAEVKARERRDAWIRELEVRDEEDKAARERARQLREKRKEMVNREKEKGERSAGEGEG